MSMSNGTSVLQPNSADKQSSTLSFSMYLSSGEVFVLAVVSAVIAFNGLLGNLVVISSVFSDRKYSDNPTNLLLCSLAVADFLVCSIAGPVYICALFLPLVRISGSITSSLGIGSVGGIVCLTVNRFISIIWSLQYPRIVTFRRIKTVIFLKWMISIVVLVNKTLGPEANQAKQNQVGIFLLPLAMTTVLTCYVWIYKKSTQHQKAIKRHTNVITGQQAGREADFKSVFSLLLVTGTFFIAWLPPTLIFIFIDENKSPQIYYRYGTFCIPLVLANSAFNPVIYYLRSENFRTVLARFYRLYIASWRSDHQTRAHYVVKRRNTPRNDFHEEVTRKPETAIVEISMINVQRGRCCALNESELPQVTGDNCNGLNEEIQRCSGGSPNSVTIVIAPVVSAAR